MIFWCFREFEFWTRGNCRYGHLKNVELPGKKWFSNCRSDFNLGTWKYWKTKHFDHRGTGGGRGVGVGGGRRPGKQEKNGRGKLAEREEMYSKIFWMMWVKPHCIIYINVKLFFLCLFSTTTPAHLFGIQMYRKKKGQRKRKRKKKVHSLCYSYVTCN